jgi:phosphate acyltransferase
MSISEVSSSIELPVAIDAMGGDFGSSVAVEGAVMSWNTLGIRTILVGKKSELEGHLNVLGISAPNGISIVDAPDVVEMDESPSVAIRKKPDSSIRVAFRLVSECKACAVLGAGNTGAMMASGIVEWDTLPSLARPAIASLVPKQGNLLPAVLLDCGANIECQASQLVQFAIMGDLYAKKLLGYDTPRVGLLSNGSEATKGTEVTRAASKLIQTLEGINYIGYIEATDLAKNVVDVIVCDGFVGNVFLKSIEGSVSLAAACLNEVAKDNFIGRIGLMMASPLLKAVFEDKFDPSAYGGAPLLGLKHLAIIAHGSSTPRAIMNAVKVANQLSQERLTTMLDAALKVAAPRMRSVS